tara:strand:+ start:19 stop:798 length:780 start_codon:yes stop_codon:yes gene_type:complete
MKNKKCKNCGNPLIGEYCAGCGQKDVDLLEFKKLIKDFFDHHLDLDSRLFRTIKYLITSPGFLTTEYWNGKRAIYVPPFKLYLITSLLYFFIYSLLPTPTLSENGPDFIKDNIENEEKGFSVKKIGEIIDTNMEKYEKEIELFFFLPLTAIALMVLNKNITHLHLSHHFIASLHLSSAFFIIFMVVESLTAYFPNYSSLINYLYIFQFLYTTISFKHIYNGSFLISSIKTLILFFLTIAMVMILVFAIASIYSLFHFLG